MFPVDQTRLRLLKVLSRESVQARRSLRADICQGIQRKGADRDCTEDGENQWKMKEDLDANAICNKNNLSGVWHRMLKPS